MNGKRPALLPTAAACLAVPGEFWECGVHRGKTSVVLRNLLRDTGRTLRLFDTFAGRPAKGRYDTGRSLTSFDDTSLAAVQALLPEPFVAWHPGLIPETFAGLEDARIAFAYVDLDLYSSTRDALAFIRPRLVPGGAIVVDDYDDPTWPGVTVAVDALGAAVARIARQAVLR